MSETRYDRYNRSEKGRARSSRYEACRSADGRKAATDARYYAQGGWYAVSKRDLRRRIATKLERLETLA